MRSRHSDSLALRRQTGSRQVPRGGDMHKAPNKHTNTHIHTDHATRRKKTDRAEGENAARRRARHHLVILIHAHIHTLRSISDNRP